MNMVAFVVGGSVVEWRGAPTVCNYHPQTKFAKVMFLHLSVSHSIHWGRGWGWYPSMHYRSPGPHPGEKLRGLALGVSRPTPGEVSRPTPGGSPGPHLGVGVGSTGPHPGGCVSQHALRQAPPTPPPTIKYYLCWSMLEMSKVRRLFRPSTPLTCFDIHSIWWYGWKALSLSFSKQFLDWKFEHNNHTVKVRSHCSGDGNGKLNSFSCCCRHTQCEHHHLTPWYSFIPLLLKLFPIEPIHGGNGNDTKTMKIMPLPPQCEQAFNVKQ